MRIIKQVFKGIGIILLGIVAIVYGICFLIVGALSALLINIAIFIYLSTDAIEDYLKRTTKR